MKLHGFFPSRKSKDIKTEDSGDMSGTILVNKEKMKPMLGRYSSSDDSVPSVAITAEELRNISKFQPVEKEVKESRNSEELGKTAFILSHLTSRAKYEKRHALQNIKTKWERIEEERQPSIVRSSVQRKSTARSINLAKAIYANESYSEVLPHKKTTRLFDTQVKEQSLVFESIPSDEELYQIRESEENSEEKSEIKITRFTPCRICSRGKSEISLRRKTISLISVDIELTDEEHPELLKLRREKIKKTSFLGLKRFRRPNTLSAYDEIFSMPSINLRNEWFLLNLVSLSPLRDMHSLMDRLEHDSMKIEAFVCKWNFLHLREELIFTIPKGSPFDVAINAYRNYDFELSKTFYKFLFRCNLRIELFARIEGEKDKFLGDGMLILKEGLLTPNEIAECEVSITNDSFWRLNHVRRAKHCYIHFRYIFKGRKFDNFSPKSIPLIEEEATPEETPDYLYPKQSLVLPEIPAKQLSEFQDGLDLVLLRFRSLNYPQRAIDADLKQMVTWIHRELQWQLTIEKNCILTGRDPATASFRQFRDDKTNALKFRTLEEDDIKLNNPETIQISVIELLVPKKSYLFLNSNVTYVYAEIMFLNFNGRSVESDRVLKTFDPDEPIIFNFTKVFYIDLTDDRARLLARHVEENESVMFSIISEPIAADDSNYFNCASELGRGSISYHDLVQGFDDVCNAEITIYDDDQSIIGYLKIQIAGVLKIRALALKYLSVKYDQTNLLYKGA